MSRKKTPPDIVTFAGSDYLELVTAFVLAARGDSALFEAKDCVLSVYPDKGRIVVDVSNQSTGGNLHVIWDAAAQSLVVHKMRNGQGECFRLGEGCEGLFAKGRWKKNSKTKIFVKESRKDQFLGLDPESVQDYFEELKAAVERVSDAASQSVPQPF